MVHGRQTCIHQPKKRGSGESFGGKTHCCQQSSQGLQESSKNKKAEDVKTTKKPRKNSTVKNNESKNQNKYPKIWDIKAKKMKWKEWLKKTL